MRVKRGQVARKRHQKVLKLTKGFRGRHRSLFRVSNQQKMKAFKYAYQDRRLKKRTQRRLWIARINALVRQYSWSCAPSFCTNKQKQTGLKSRNYSIEPCNLGVTPENMVLKTPTCVSSMKLGGYEAR